MRNIFQTLIIKIKSQKKSSMSSTPILNQNLQKMQQNYESQNEKVEIKLKGEKKTNSYTKWTREQDVLYVRFLKGNLQRMKKTTFRKPYNKFKKMSEYVITKDSFQCRSHHQKMIKKYSDIENIIQNLAVKFTQTIKRKPKESQKNVQLNLVTLSTEKTSTPEIEKQTVLKDQNGPSNQVNVRNQLFSTQHEKNNNQTVKKLQDDSYHTVFASKNLNLNNPLQMSNQNKNNSPCAINEKTNNRWYQDGEKNYENEKEQMRIQKQRQIKSLQLFYQARKTHLIRMNQAYPYEYMSGYGGPRHDFMPRDFHFTQPYYHNYGQICMPPYPYGMPHPHCHPDQPFWPHYVPRSPINQSPSQQYSTIQVSKIKTEVKLQQ